MMALRQSGSEVWSTDVAVPMSRLAELIGDHQSPSLSSDRIILTPTGFTEISKRELDELGLFAGVLGHVGDGNFHESILYDNTNPKERAAVEKCVHRALEMEGTCTVRSLAISHDGYPGLKQEADTRPRVSMASGSERRNSW